MRGADTAFPVTKQLIDQATAALTERPAFWGRYFTSPETTGSVEYRHALEDAVLAAAGIRVLPVARQTNHVGGDLASGTSDGAANARDLVETFGEANLAAGCPNGALVFLDVEGSGASRLSTDYYTGWAAGLASVSSLFVPCVYGIPGDATTWTALARAIAAGSPCGGLWLARPLLNVNEATLAWSANMVPAVDPGAPVLLWQYAFPQGGINVDRDLVNPAVDAQADVLARLISPPGPATA